ncbi:MAG: Hpt domain-containing protein [Treponema sp.]|nr:Hpt domain-containing protein [Treponema sp.]
MDQILNTEAARDMLDNDLSLYRILLESYINDKILDGEKLVSLEKKEDTTEAAKYVHYFKGAARQLGAEVLAREGQSLEDVLRKKADGNLEILNKNFIDAYVTAVEAMKVELASLPEE